MSRVIAEQLAALASKQVAAQNRRFFKTARGEYAEGDVFIGVRMPVIRNLARRYRDEPVSVAMRLLKTKIHEQRLLALVMLIEHYQLANSAGKKTIYQFYIDNTRYINNWDLIDISAAHIVGAYLETHSRRPLYQLARSADLWQRRIAIIATFWFIKNNDFTDTLRICEQLLDDEHDLIHKASGWMLREVAKRDRNTAEEFLRAHHQVMPRTMLRYAIERFPETLRQKYLQGRI